MGHAIGDWDNNGLLDWFSSAIWHNRTECSVTGCTFDNKGNVLFHNLGGRRFEDVTDRVTLITLQGYRISPLVFRQPSLFAIGRTIWGERHIYLVARGLSRKTDLFFSLVCSYSFSP